ncbi:MAG: type I 3-dehydroquinate dehydratase [Bacteroidales bacterium]|nr:type I 3-dehydroquinate dehydratase [Bacteroidales bacterium]
MICTSIQHKELQEILDLLDSGTVEMAEIRLDRCALEDEDIDLLFSASDVPLIATCRMNEESQAPELLEKAVRAGAKYVDLEMEAPAAVGRRIREACREYGTVLIRSFHDFTGTPPVEVLRSILERGRQFGGEVVKIVTTATCKADIDPMMELYREAEPGTLVAFCMGEDGRESRLEALRQGAPFTYACLTEEEATAPGQWTAEAMRKEVYGGFRFVQASALPMPSSKSFAQRAIVAAALADGVSNLSGYTPCGDNESAIAVARTLGASVDISNNMLTIRGINARPGCCETLEELHTGESGFLTRLMVPLMAVLPVLPVRITGEKTLLKRPLADAHDIMAAFGVRLFPESNNAVTSSKGVENAGNKVVSEARKSDCYLPMRVSGPLLPGRADISGRGGSQLISGLLAALPLSGSKSTVYVHDPKSIPYLFITVDVLKKFGIRIGSEMEGGDDFLETQDWSLCTGINFRIKGDQRYQAADFAIEADWSGAAPFLTAGAIFGQVEVEGLDTQSLQADISMMDILMDAGASMSQQEGSTPTNGPIRVQRAPLNAFSTDLNNCPDLFPMVAVLAAFCPGESHILGVERLRHKETDRAAAIEAMLRQMGVPVAIDQDEMTITGMGLTQRILTGKLLKGGHFPSYGDHRMVMALKVASLGAAEPVIIDDVACVAKSFPTFNEMFSVMTGAGRPS